MYEQERLGTEGGAERPRHVCEWRPAEKPAERLGPGELPSGGSCRRLAYRAASGGVWIGPEKGHPKERPLRRSERGQRGVKLAHFADTVLTRLNNFRESHC